MHDRNSLVARTFELSAVVEVLESAARGRGEGVLISGEAGIGKTRMLQEAEDEAYARNLLVLRGRAVESGGAYRPVVEAFARPAAPFALHDDLAGVRPALARVLPGWVSEGAVLAPMADPTAVLAEALMLLVQVMSPKGAALILDDLHWADADTLSVLASFADAVDKLPLALVFAVRSDVRIPESVIALCSGQSMRHLPLRRLEPAEVGSALQSAGLANLFTDRADELVAAIDGLPLIMDEVVRGIRDGRSPADAMDLGSSTLASAVQFRLERIAPETRVVLDALAVVGDTDPEVLTAATGLDAGRLGASLHAAVASTLLVRAPTPLGVSWRHILIRNAVRNLLLPLEQQAIARRAADCLASVTAPTDGQLRQAATLYQVAGTPQQSAQQLIRAARIAVANAALDTAEQYLHDAQALFGRLPGSAHDVLIEQIETLTVAGRASDGLDSGMTALRQVGSPDSRPLLVATARAAFAAGNYQEGTELLNRLERDSELLDAHVAVLRAHLALAERRIDAAELSEQAATLAQREGRFDLACEALVLKGVAARRFDPESAAEAFQAAIDLSQRKRLRIWEVRANAELGVIDEMTDSDPTRLEQARTLAAQAGMVGTVAEIDMRIAETIIVRQGYVATYPTILRAVTQARQLRLTGLQARASLHLMECILLADPSTSGTNTSSGQVDVEATIAEARALMERLSFGRDFPFGVQAWLQGDNPTAIRLIEEGQLRITEEVKLVPWAGFAALLRVVEGATLEDAFGPPQLTGHHANWAARAFGTALWQLRSGLPGDAAFAEAEHHLRNTPFWRHLLHTVVAPVVFDAGVVAAEGWLREADSFFGAAGERRFQRRVRHTLADIGAKVARNSASVPPHLARLGLTVREVEILRFVNAGLTNSEIGKSLFISTRTVESHVSSLLQKTDSSSRDQLPKVASTP